MPLMPEDIVRKTFKTSLFRGYAEQEVDAFLEEVVGELRRLHSLLDELKAQLQESVQGATEDRAALIETEQLEHVRRERAALVGELTELQLQYDRMRAEVRSMEERLSELSSGEAPQSGT